MARMETTMVVKEEALEKQLSGCMAGFFNIFDRPHLLSPKRLSSPQSSPLHSGDLKHQSLYSTPELRSPAPDLTLPATLEIKETSSRSPWRFCKEAPRLSLDSRAVVDAKGSLKPRQIRPEPTTDCSGSPSVIARLMGLEPLPSNAQPLQRSASESRVPRDYRFVDSFNPSSDEKGSTVGVDPPEFNVRSGRAQPARAPAPQRYVVRRKSAFDPADFFPEPRQCGGLEAPTSDLETLKQLLEAVRLKGLLHSSNKQPNRNLVYEDRESPIRSGVSPSASPRKGRSPSVKNPNRRSVLKDERVSPLPWRRPERVQTIEKTWKVEEDEYKKQGKTLLERCDKLLHSIAEMEAGVESQPSPVSVLDASLFHEDSSPSPVMKRTLDFFFAESEDDELWTSSSDSEYAYILDILRASDWLPQESDIFSLLEKQQYLKGKCASRAAAQERRLVFDAVQEIMGRRKRLPPWKTAGNADKLQVIWSEFQKMRKKRSSTKEDLVGYVCGILGRDITEDRWEDCEVEMSEAVLDIERLVFKDLIGETILHLGAVNRWESLRLRRRLLF